jgi:WD40 repeat protein
MIDNVLNHIYRASIKEHQKKLSDYYCTHILKDLADLASGYDYYIEGTTHILDNNRTISCIELLPDGRIAYETEKNEIKICNLETGNCDSTLKYHNFMGFITITQKGNIISGTYEGNLREWNPITQFYREICAKNCFEGFIQFALELFDERVAAGSFGEIKIINAQNGNVDLSLDHPRVYNCLALPDGRIVSVSWDALKIWNVITGICEFDLGYGMGGCINILSHGRIAGGLKNGKIIILSPEKGTCKYKIDVVLEDDSLIEAPCIRSIIELSDGKIITTTNEEYLIKVWDIDSGTKPMILKGHIDRILCMAELPDGRIISGSNDHTIKIWNLKTSDSTKRCEMTLSDNTSINCIKILSSGQIVSGSGNNSGGYPDRNNFDDGTLKIWS